jgi:hypothetical protein
LYTIFKGAPLWITQNLLRDIKLGFKLLPTANTSAYLTEKVSSIPFLITPVFLEIIKLDFILLPTANTLAYLTKKDSCLTFSKRPLCHIGKKISNGKHSSLSD